MPAPPTDAATAFSPGEVQGEVRVPAGLAPWRKLFRFLGPGLLVAVGYMDPGNWATDIQGGAHYGYALLSVVVLSSLAAVVLQVLSLRLGLASGRDLAELCRERYPRWTAVGLWGLAEVAIVACDLAEVLGAALAFKLLLHVPLAWGVALTGFDTVLVLGLKGRGVRQMEAIVLGLVLTIGACFAAELVFARPAWGAVAKGLLPTPAILRDPGMLYVAVGIVGATVMPHNLYLHSSIVRTRKLGGGARSLPEAMRLATLDTVAALTLALLVNAAILVLAGAAFHRMGALRVDGIEDAYRLLTPLTGAAAAALLFGVALLASGQSSTLTGTIAGQVVLEGFLQLRMARWKRRIVTRGLALVPALLGVWWLGDGSVGRLLVGSQVVLSAQLPFAIWPLLRFSGDPAVMGAHRSPRWLRGVGWGLLAAITAANAWLLLDGGLG